MNEWARVRAVPIIIGASTALMIAAWIVQGRAILMPTLLGGDSALMPIRSLLPLLWSGLLTWSLSARNSDSEVRSVRPVAWLDIGWFLGINSIAGLTLGFIDSGVNDAWNLTPSLLFMAGTSVDIATRWHPGTAIIITTFIFIATAFYSVYNRGSGIVRFLDVGGDPAWAWLFGLTACAAAVTALLATRRRVRPSADPVTL